MVPNYYCCFSNTTNNKGRAIIEVTNRCNLKCLHCQTPIQESVFESKADLKSLISQIHNIGFGKITFSGGEPLLFKRLTEYAAYGKSLGLEMELLSNLTLYGKQSAHEKALIHNTFHNIVTSLDGANSNSHGYLRGDKLSFSQTIAAIRELAEAGKKVKVLSVIHRENTCELDDIIELCVSLGVYSVLFINPKLAGRARDNQDLIPDAAEIARAGAEISSRYRDEKRISVGLSRFQGLSYEDMGSCHAIDKIIYITADGGIYPCQHFTIEDPPNVMKTSLRQALSGETLLRVQETIHRKEKSKCILQDSCERGCRAFMHIPGEDYPPCDPDCCQYKERTKWNQY